MNWKNLCGDRPWGLYYLIFETLASSGLGDLSWLVKNIPKAAVLDRSKKAIE